MSRYVALASLDPRNIPSYYIVDTSNNSRVRRYDCQAWAEHEARRMNGDREERRRAEFPLALQAQSGKNQITVFGGIFPHRESKSAENATETARKDK